MLQLLTGKTAGNIGCIDRSQISTPSFELFYGTYDRDEIELLVSDLGDLLAFSAHHLVVACCRHLNTLPRFTKRPLMPLPLPPHVLYEYMFREHGNMANFRDSATALNPATQAMRRRGIEFLVSLLPPTLESLQLGLIFHDNISFAPLVLDSHALQPVTYQLNSFTSNLSQTLPSCISLIAVIACQLLHKRWPMI
jgi:hypothetical protein